MALDMINIVYLEAQHGCGFVALSVALCIGCARAIVFKDWQAVVWIDIHPMLAVLFLAVFLCEILQDALVWGLDKALAASLRQCSFPFVEYATIQGQTHPLADMSKVKATSGTSYIVIFVAGTTCMFLLLLIFLGEDFMFSRCNGLVQSASFEVTVSVKEYVHCL